MRILAFRNAIAIPYSFLPKSVTPASVSHYLFFVFFLDISVVAVLRRPWHGKFVLSDIDGK